MQKGTLSGKSSRCGDGQPHGRAQAGPLTTPTIETRVFCSGVLFSGSEVAPGSSRLVLTSTRGIASTCPLIDNAQGSQAQLGPCLLPPQSTVAGEQSNEPVDMIRQKSVAYACSNRCAAPQNRPRLGPRTVSPSAQKFRNKTPASAFERVMGPCGR